MQHFQFRYYTRCTSNNIGTQVTSTYVVCLYFIYNYTTLTVKDTLGVLNDSLVFIKFEEF